MMQPIRSLQAATHFKKASGPSRTDPNVIVDDLLEPCSPGDAGAMEMTWEEIDPNKLSVLKISYRDFQRSVKQNRPTVSQGDLGAFVDFTRNFGQEG